MSNTEQGKKTAKRIAKGAAIAARGAFKIVAGILGPYAVPAAVITIAIFFIVGLFAGLTYSAMPSKTILTTNSKPTKEDEEIQKEYIDLCEEFNIEETWLVKREPTRENTYSTGSGIKKLGDMLDHNGRDRDVKLDWGTVHAAALFYAYSAGKEEISSDMRRKIASDFRPYFYYKESEITVYPKGEDAEPYSYDVHLLVEADTIYGHWIYNYEWVTEDRGSYSIKYERLDQKITISRWERLEEYMMNLCQTDGSDNEEMRIALIEAGKGFTKQQEWLAWMLENLEVNDFVSGAIVPAELMPIFKEVGEEYGIPWWFLAAVAFQESSFNPQAGMYGHGPYGLMQVTYTNWLHYAEKLGFNAEEFRDDPKTQVVVGAEILMDYGLRSVNWNSRNLEEELLPVLVEYGGFEELPVLKRAKYDSVEEWCLDEYIRPILDKANKIRLRGITILWPVIGTVTSEFGFREHPVSGGYKQHNGIDIAAPLGEPVVSCSAGQVIMAGWQNPNNHDEGYGLRVYITDGVHLYVYAHLSEISVKEGQIVKPAFL